MPSDRDNRRLGVTERDPTGSEFDGYAQPTPPGEWRYVLDEHGVKYRRQGWPFGREPSRVTANYTAKHGTRQEANLVPTGVRVSPATDYRSWRNEYVLLYPGRLHEYGTDDGTTEFAHAYLNLWVREQGLGGIIVPRVEVELDMQNAAVRVSDECPEQVREQATVKAARLLAFLLKHRQKARKPRSRRTPVTAYDLWAKQQAHGH